MSRNVILAPSLGVGAENHRSIQIRVFWS